MPPPLSTYDVDDEIRDVIPVLHGAVRLALVAVAVLLLGVFATAVYLNPYENGEARRLETHRQLGLPPCTFYFTTRLPCPSCGMTTSFALLMHGDVVNSARANAVGTLLALFWLALIPWSLLCAVRGRPYLIRSLETGLTWSVVTFLVLLLGRWVVVLGLTWWQGGAGPFFWNSGGPPPADSRRSGDDYLQGTTLGRADPDHGGPRRGVQLQPPVLPDARPRPEA